MFVLRYLVAFQLLSLSFGAASAADIVSYAKPDDWYATSKDGCSFTISGEIKQGDRDRLIKALNGAQGGRGSSLVACLNSEGGNFDEGIKIGEFFLKSLVATRIKPHQKCLSACAIMFMAGQNLDTDGFHLDRSMSASSVLGFHSPYTTLSEGTFDSSDLQMSYNEAVDSVGRRLLRYARHIDRNRINPLIKPGLINEMMLAKDFYYIDTVRKAVEWEISVDAPEIKPRSIADHRNTCMNAIAALTDSRVADWFFTIGIQKLTQDATGITFLMSQRHNVRCRTTAGTSFFRTGVSELIGGSTVEFSTGIGSGARTVEVGSIAALPANTPLRRLASDQIKALQNEFPRPAWCPKTTVKAEALVCNTPEFAAADTRMEHLYAQLLRRPGDKNIDAIRSEQRTWLAKRNACSDYLCVDNAYATRIIDLEGEISVAQ